MRVLPSSCYFDYFMPHSMSVSFNFIQFLCYAQVPVSNDTAPVAVGTNRSNTTLPVSACASGRQIPFSNRGPSNECFASKLGDECEYQCNDGYIGVGRHVCQTIYIDNEARVSSHCISFCRILDRHPDHKFSEIIHNLPCIAYIKRQSLAQTVAIKRNLCPFIIFHSAHPFRF